MNKPKQVRPMFQQRISIADRIILSARRRVRRNGLIWVCLLLAFAGSMQAGPRYVATNGTDSGTYESWTTAASNIQLAVTAAQSGETVWISNGVYVLTNQITVAKSITVSGIATGDKPVVDGNSNRCFDFTTAGTGTLANLTITRGYTNSDGGGVYMRYGTVRDCIFSNNIAANRGGGLMLVGGTNIVQRCTFVENKAKNGGGVAMVATLNNLIDDCSFQTNIAFVSGGGMYNNGSRTLITNCDFICNVATNQGGGCWVESYLDATKICVISHCMFTNNIAVTDDGGGMRLYANIHLASNCWVYNNIASNGGGGIVIYGDTVKNCIVARNTSQSQSGNMGGGGIHMHNGLVQDCIIEENTAGYYAGGVYFSGGTLRNCLIRNNIASGSSGGRGGAMRVFATSADIQSCTIVSNYAKWGGGGIYNDRAADYTARVDNCIVYFNKAGSVPTSSNLYDQSASSSYSNCCVAGWAYATDVVITNNNITDNPQCVEWTSGNYRLSRNSRCVNAGVYREWMNGAVDLDGHSRIDKFSGIIDIGCYEYLPSGTMFGFH